MGENSTLGIAAIIAAIILVLAVFVILFVVKEKRRVQGLSPAERAIHDAVVAAKNEHRDALREYRDRSAAAEKVYRREMGALEAHVRSAEAAMKKAEKTGRELIQSYQGKDGNVALFEHQIVVNGSPFPLDDSVSAVVDSSGNLARTKRSTLTRMTAGGVLLGPVGILAGGMLQKKKVHDDRELYLMVEGQDFTALITCHPGHGAAVRQFAAKISQASKTVDLANARHEEATIKARRQLEQASAEAEKASPAIQARLEQVKAQNAQVVGTRRRLLELGEKPKDLK